MQFEIKNKFTSAVQFTADIAAEENAALSSKVGLAVKWGVKTKANLQDANLRGANLRGANLRGANLRGANLRGANLQDANLQDANLQDANLWGANLRGANLRGANLRGANLQDANLQGANLQDANLWGANLRGANLWGANLRGANLWGANLRGANVVIMQGLKYQVSINADKIRIGCEDHTTKEWKNLTDEQIIRMDGKDALSFWTTYKDSIITLAETCYQPEK